jgi:hypothetical protein
MFPTPRYLGREQAAEQLTAEGVKATSQTLADLAYKRTGPRFVRINGRALYTREWLLAWIEEQAAKPVQRRRRRTAQQEAPAP